MEYFLAPDYIEFMTETQFCSWLRGFIDGKTSLTPEDLRKVHKELENIWATPSFVPVFQKENPFIPKSLPNSYPFEITYYQR